MQIVKDEELILTAHPLMYFSLQNSSRLVFVHWRVSCSKILTTPFLKDFLQNLVPSLYRSIYVKSISEAVIWHSVKVPGESMETSNLLIPLFCLIDP